MNQLPIVYYHNEDADGCFAAYAAYLAYGAEGAEYVGLRAGATVPTAPGRDVVVLDLALDAPELAALRETSKTLRVIDHHASAAEAYATAPDCVTFDPSHAACVLAWRHFQPRTPTPELYLHVEDRDLWRFKLTLSREINAALWSRPWSWQWAESCVHSIGKLATDGAAILRWIDREVERIALTAMIRDFAGRKVPVVNCALRIVSEVGAALLKRFPDYPFAATFRVESDGRFIWQLRSRATAGAIEFDVAGLAKELGGGGHPTAAGCTAPAADPYFQSASGPAPPDGSAIEPAEPEPTAAVPTQKQTAPAPTAVPPAETSAHAGRPARSGRH